MNVAIIVTSMPAFSKFFRMYVWSSRILNALRTAGRLGEAGSGKLFKPQNRVDPNQHRTGRDEHRAQKRRNYYELDDTLLAETQGTKRDSIVE